MKIQIFFLLIVYPRVAKVEKKKEGIIWANQVKHNRVDALSKTKIETDTNFILENKKVLCIDIPWIYRVFAFILRVKFKILSKQYEELTENEKF